MTRIVDPAVSPIAPPLDLRRRPRAEARRPRIRATTVLCVRRGQQVVMAADGQVTLGSMVFKATARKLRRMAEGESSVASPAAQPMAWRCLSGWKPSSSSTAISCRGPQSSWPKTGAQIGCCDA